MTPWNNNGRRHTGARRAQLSWLGHCCAVVLLICFVDKSTERSGVNGASAGPGTPTCAAQSWWQARVKSVTYLPANAGLHIDSFCQDIIPVIIKSIMQQSYTYENWINMIQICVASHLDYQGGAHLRWANPIKSCHLLRNSHVEKLKGTIHLRHQQIFTIFWLLPP